MAKVCSAEEAAKLRGALLAKVQRFLVTENLEIFAEGCDDGTASVSVVSTLESEPRVHAILNEGDEMHITAELIAETIRSGEATSLKKCLKEARRQLTMAKNDVKIGRAHV